MISIATNPSKMTISTNFTEESTAYIWDHIKYDLHATNPSKMTLSTNFTEHPVINFHRNLFNKFVGDRC
jgi:hypothetical protein